MFISYLQLLFVTLVLICFLALVILQCLIYFLFPCVLSLAPVPLSLSPQPAFFFSHLQSVPSQLSVPCLVTNLPSIHTAHCQSLLAISLCLTAVNSCYFLFLLCLCLAAFFLFVSGCVLPLAQCGFGKFCSLFSLNIFIYFMPLLFWFFVLHHSPNMTYIDSNLIPCYKTMQSSLSFKQSKMFSINPADCIQSLTCSNNVDTIRHTTEYFLMSWGSSRYFFSEHRLGFLVLYCQQVLTLGLCCGGHFLPSLLCLNHDL